uniref:Glycosyltransferase family 92 protein n=1 Tax=Setaria digitata TaxID=48799 RepID=A0A915Q5Z9_9BILA
MMNFTANITDETLFVYKAFLDLRQNEPLIRVLAFSKCHDIKILLHYGSHCISGKDVTIEYDCPWKWVPECKWFSFMLIFNMKFTNFSVDTKEIIVTKGEQMVSIPLVPLPRYHQDTLHVCVPPLYWYWNYVAFIQFIEIWRMQGASMFYIYYVSVNRHVMDILKIYEKMLGQVLVLLNELKLQGIIRLIRWQMMPRSEKTDPNRSGRLLPFLRKMHNSNNVAGSFVFEHARVRFQGWNILKLQLKLDFNWLKNAEFQIQEGPSKTVFMPERVQIVVTHKVRQFLKSHRSMKIDTKDGLLYHARSNWIFTTLNDSVYHPTDIFHGYITSLNSAYEKIMSLVSWPEWNLVPAWKMLSKRIEKCTSKWRMYGCKAPHHLCWNALNDQDNWIFSHVNTSSHYILL